MPPHYSLPDQMARLAQRTRGPTRLDLPALLVLSDPRRTSDPIALARTIPARSGLVYRHFGVADRFDIARMLRTVTREKGCYFAVSADVDLAQDCGADGVHWPEARIGEALHANMQNHGLIFTAATHSVRAVHRARQAGIDAAICSPVFDSRSASAGHALGVCRLSLFVRQAVLPVYALGGVNMKTGRRLTGRGLAGLACVDGIVRG